MHNRSTILTITDEETKIMTQYFKRIGSLGGAACKGRESAKIRAIKAGRASAEARRKKKGLQCK
jgi:hypothetical protein